MARIIAVVSQKGGVGKTTTSVNLAASLAALEKRVLVVGMDPQCGISLSFGFTRNTTPSGMYDVLFLNAPITDAVKHTDIRFLDVIPSNVRTSDEEDVIQGVARKDKFKLKQIFDDIRQYYEYIIVDCPPSLGPLTISSMIAADSILIPVQAEYFSRESIGRMIKTATDVAKNHNPDLSIEGVLLTMVDYRTKLGRKITEDIKNALGSKVFKTLVPRTVKLAEAPMEKKPAILLDINSRGAQAYLNLALEIVGE